MLAMGSDDGFVSLCCPSVFFRFLCFFFFSFFGPFFHSTSIRLSRYQGILVGFTGYYWVLLGFALCLVYRVLLGFTSCYWVFVGFTSYCGFLQVLNTLAKLIEFYWVSQMITGFLIGLYCFGGCRPFSEFTELYWVLLPIAEFVFGDFRPFQRVNRVLLGFADNDRV